MARRRLVTWRMARGLLLFGGLGVVLSVGAAWGIRHAHYANGYPTNSGRMTAQSFRVALHGEEYGLLMESGLGRRVCRFLPSGQFMESGHTDTTLQRLRIWVRASALDREVPRTRRLVVPPGNAPVRTTEAIIAEILEDSVRLDYESVPDRWIVLEHEAVPSWVDLPDGQAGSLTTAYGWPLPAMTECVRDLGLASRERVWLWTPGNTDASGLNRARPVAASHEFGFPIRPVWWGLLGNAAIYGGVCWMTTAGVRWSWRRLRHKPGTCRGCGYDLAGLPAEEVCPECGGAISTGFARSGSATPVGS